MADLVGKTILHYKILQQIGQGGMGIVYLAEDKKLKRKIAIKFLPEHIANNAEERLRFEVEAQAAAALNHPNIATIHAIEDVDKEIFIVMEYIDGKELKDIIGDQKTISQAEAIDYCIQIARGLEIAHQNDIVHRDIKSSNIMISKNGMVKIMDFGLAQIGKEKQEIKTKSTIGTAAYMSPEQANREPVGPLTDIWAFGVILYELLSGELPFKGEYEQAVMYSILNEEPEPIKKLMPDLSENLIDLVHRCLTKVKAKRIQSASEIIKLLDSGHNSKAEQIDSGKISGQELDAKRLAVLPFSNISPAAEDEYMAEGMTEELISTLSKISELRVIARTSVMQYKNTTKNISEIGNELRVGTVLQGSVRKSENQLRISVQLIDTVSEELLFSQDYNRRFYDILVIQTEIALQVSDVLKVKLLGEGKNQIDRSFAVNPEAYNFYLKGRFFWNKRTESDLIRCIEYLDLAVEKDPDFALAYAALADAYIVFGDYNYLTPNEAFPKARNAAEKALVINNNLAQAHTALACIKSVYEWDWDGAEKEFKLAQNLNSDYAVSHHWYAINFLVPQRRYEKAISEINRALEIDPLSLIINTTAGLVYYFAGDFKKSIQKFEETLAYDDNFSVAHYFSGWAYAQVGDTKKAIESMNNAISISGDSIALQAELGCVYALCGEIKDALVIYKQIQKTIDDKITSAYSMYSIAAFYACLFKTDVAIEWLQRAFEERSYRLIYLTTDPWFKNIQTDPRIKALVKKLQLSSD